MMDQQLIENSDLRLRTLMPYDRVEELRASCCTKLYSLTLDGLQETRNGPCKVLRISFEDAADRERFRDTFAKRSVPSS